MADDDQENEETPSSSEKINVYITLEHIPDRVRLKEHMKRIWLDLNMLWYLSPITTQEMFQTSNIWQYTLEYPHEKLGDWYLVVIKIMAYFTYIRYQY